MANASVFMSAMPRVRSTTDYMKEMEDVESQRKRNALADLAMQSTTAEMDRAQRAETEAQRRFGVQSGLYAQAGGDENKLISLLRSSGDPSLWGEASKIEDSSIGRKKTAAEVKKAEAETQAKEFELKKARRAAQIQAMATAQTPAQAIEMLNIMDDIPPQERAQIIQMMAGVQTPQQFMMLKGLTVLGLATPEQQAKGMAPEYKDTGGALANVNPYAGQTQPITKTATPGDVMQAETTRRGQNMTDARVRERFEFDKQQAGRPEFDSTTGAWIDKNTRTVTPVAGVTGGGGKPLTDAQAKALLFGSRAMEAHNVLAEMESVGVRQPGAIKRVAETAGQIVGLGTSFGDVLGSTAGALTNWTQSPQQQQVEQAQRDFINAILRRESGAVISDSEFDNARKQYFPQPNDDDKVIERKRRTREIAIRGLMAEVPENKRVLPDLPGLATQKPKAATVDVPPDIESIINKHRRR